VARTDLVAIAAANAVNLLIAALFLARLRGSSSEYWLGLAAIAMGVPLLVVLVSNAQSHRACWAVVQPGLMVVYLVVELLLDYVWKINFRGGPLLWPYVLLYYTALMAMVGYAFLVGRAAGFITLATYFINLGMSAWAHGGPEP
jgi:hypothetical protein